jgi:hypothetical protein
VLDRLADAVVSLHPDRRIRVAIDGVDGAGKTVLADALAPLIVARGRPMIRASVDDFHNTQAIRYARGRYSPEGYYLDSYNYDAFRKRLLGSVDSARSRRAVEPALCPRPEMVSRRMRAGAAGRYRDRLQRFARAGDIEMERFYAACPLKSVMVGLSPLSGFCGSRL